MKRWEGLVTGLLVLGGLALSAVALVRLSIAQWDFMAPADEADRDAETAALRFAWVACAPFLAAALILARGGKRATAAIVGSMALPSLVTVVFRDGLGFVLQIIAAGAAAVMDGKERADA